MIPCLEDEVSTDSPQPQMPPRIGEPSPIQPNVETLAGPLTQEESELLDARAFGHRASGKTYRKIAQLLGMPHSSAYKRVQREMGRRREEFKEDEADSRDLIVALLEGALEAIASQAYEGDLKAFHLLLQYANTRVRLAKIDNPQTPDNKMPDKLIRKLNAAVTAYEAAAAKECKAREEAKEGPLPECGSGDEKCEERKREEGAKGCEQDLDPNDEPNHGQGREQDRGQKCGQESQTVAETPVAADEKNSAKPVNTLVQPTGAIWGVPGFEGASWESEAIQPL